MNLYRAQLRDTNLFVFAIFIAVLHVEQHVAMGAPTTAMRSLDKKKSKKDSTNEMTGDCLDHESISGLYIATYTCLVNSRTKICGDIEGVGGFQASMELQMDQNCLMNGTRSWSGTSGHGSDEKATEHSEQVIGLYNPNDGTYHLVETEELGTVTGKIEKDGFATAFLTQPGEFPLVGKFEYTKSYEDKTHHSRKKAKKEKDKQKNSKKLGGKGHTSSERCPNDHISGSYIATHVCGISSRIRSCEANGKDSTIQSFLELAMDKDCLLSGTTSWQGIAGHDESGEEVEEHSEEVIGLYNPEDGTIELVETSELGTLKGTAKEDGSISVMVTQPGEFPLVSRFEYYKTDS